MRKEIEYLIKVLEQKKASSTKICYENPNRIIDVYHRGKRKELAFCINNLKKILNEAVVREANKKSETNEVNQNDINWKRRDSMV